MKCPHCDRENGSVAPVRICRCGYRDDAGRVSLAKLSNHGPGHELERLIPKFFAAEDCGCQAMARKMDRWGIEGCERQHDVIVGYLVRKGKKHKLLRVVPELASRPAAKALVTRAIANAKHNAWNGASQGDWVVGVTTSPRIQPTLVECVNSVRKCGWEPVVFAEPNSIETNCHTVRNDTRKGCWHNWLSGVRWLLDNSTASVILTVQDDIDLHPDSRAFTESVLWPSAKAGFVSLYTPKTYAIQNDGSDRPSGVQMVRTQSLHGACALAFPREVLERAIETPVAKQWIGAKVKSGDRRVIQKRRENPHIVANSDTAIGKMMAAIRRETYFMLPSPASHTAKFSTLGHGGNKGTRNCYRCADHTKPLADQIPMPPKKHRCE